MLNSWWILELSVSFTQISRYFFCTLQVTRNNKELQQGTTFSAATEKDVLVKFNERKFLFAQLGSNMLKESQRN